MIKEEQNRLRNKNVAHNFKNAGMYRQDYIAAIDIGTTKIIAIIGYISDDGTLEILGTGQTSSKGVKRGMVLNIEETASAIREAVTMAENESQLKFDEVYVGIAGQHIRSFKNNNSKNIQSPDSEITQEDVDELKNDMQNIVLENGEEIIHIIPQMYIVDKEKFVKQPVGMFGKRLEANFHIVVGEKIAEKYIYKSIERAGLIVKGLILEPLASASAVITEDEKEVGIAMIDIGGGTTDIAIFYDGIIRHTAVVPFGGDVITKDIKNTFSILERDAEKLKIENGMAIGEAAPENEVVAVPGISGREPRTFHVRLLSNIIQARMEEIIEYIIYQLENSGYYDRLGAGIKITGGGAMLTYLKQLLSYKTGLDVDIGYPLLSAKSEFTAVNSPTYSTSIGLLIRGYKLDKKQRLEAEKQEMEERERREMERKREEAKAKAEEEEVEKETKKPTKEPTSRLTQLVDWFFGKMEDNGQKM